MANKKGVPLSSVTGFPGDVATRLAELWITTAEELVSSAVMENGLAGLMTHTGLSEAEMTRLVELAQAALPPGVAFAPGDVQPFSLGALDERQPGDENEGPPSFAPLPPVVDLRARFGPVRNQGQRGTCVAFSCTAVREYLLGITSPQGDFSEQFLYWTCKKNDMIPGAGTFIRVAMQQLQEVGVCDEPVWPYNPNLIAGNEGQDPPPPGAREKALPNRITTPIRLLPAGVDGLRQTLAESKPIAFAVPVYTSWFTEPTRSTGDIRLPLPGEKLEGGHAMCMVGYEADNETPGGGYFIVRNSWGTSWASQSLTAPGHARIPFEYIRQLCNSAYTAAIEGPLPVESQKGFFEQLIDWLRGLFR